MNSPKLPDEVLAAARTLLEFFAPRSPAQTTSEIADPYVDARTSGLGPKVFRDAAKRCEFPVFKVGKKWVARRGDVAAFIERQRVKFDRREAAPNALDRAIAEGRLRVVGRGNADKKSRK